MPFHGAIFDLDGTLADTLPVCYAAFRQVFNDHLGRTLSDSEIHARFGPSEEGVLRGLIPSDADTAIEDYFTHYRAQHRLCPRPFDGIPELLADLQAKNVQLAVVTGKGPRSAAISLEALGLTDIFDLIEAGSPNGAVKPNCMRRVLAAWNLPPNQVFGVGDAPSDIRSAREVGLLPLGAAWAASTDIARLKAEQPDQLFHRVADLAAWLNGA